MSRDQTRNPEKRAALIQEMFSEIRAGQRATDAIDEASGKLLGLNRTDGHCMDLLDERGQMTAGHLAEATGLTTGAITAVLDRLEKLGYVHRIRDTEDRRRVLVDLTPEARRVTWELYGPLAAAGAAIAERYDDSELELLLGFVRESRRMGEQHAATLRERARERERERDEKG
jgi:DNA-binding MarR family transcriptional regulator